mmetsp:Transcript_40945/g.65823  ORF Transcript_40945/g.65823 Transcript_40945/m.65823 type:complete len:299 (+) Transcript_40945:2051-2947(+)
MLYAWLAKPKARCKSAVFAARRFDFACSISCSTSGRTQFGLQVFTRGMTPSRSAILSGPDAFEKSYSCSELICTPQTCARRLSIGIGLVVSVFSSAGPFSALGTHHARSSYPEKCWLMRVRIIPRTVDTIWFHSAPPISGLDAMAHQASRDSSEALETTLSLLALKAALKRLRKTIADLYIGMRSIVRRNNHLIDLAIISISHRWITPSGTGGIGMFPALVATRKIFFELSHIRVAISPRYLTLIPRLWSSLVKLCPSTSVNALRWTSITNAGISFVLRKSASLVRFSFASSHRSASS